MERMKKKCPDMRFILKGKLIGWMMNAKLVVIDHPQTAFIEALAINVPSIFYWDHEVYLMRPEAEEYYEALRRAGVLYKTPEDAARKLSEVFDDSMGWWKSREIQDARNIFLERFGSSRKDWLNIWAEELKKIKGCCLRNNGIA
jgi:putative transferase (TIGR04331 family)